MGYNKDKEDMEISLDNPTTHITVRSDMTDVTVRGQAFEEAVSELGRVVVQRVVTSP